LSALASLHGLIASFTVCRPTGWILRQTDWASKQRDVFVFLDWIVTAFNYEFTSITKLRCTQDRFLLQAAELSLGVKSFAKILNISMFPFTDLNHRRHHN